MTTNEILEEFRETFPPMEHYLDKSVSEGIAIYFKDKLDQQAHDNEILVNTVKDIMFWKGYEQGCNYQIPKRFLNEEEIENITKIGKTD
jgi:hypothetical protein